jgi:YD repeat-containing protein
MRTFTVDDNMNLILLNSHSISYDMVVRYTQILIIIFLAGWQTGWSQTVKEPAFTSPNSASLAKFEDIPVSYHTGVPEIGVSLFRIQEGNLSIGLTLNYHSSGIKVEDVSSWVGLGWSLDAGGSITRVINGGPDEGKSSTFLPASDCGITGWYKDYGIPTCLDLNSSGCGSVNPANDRFAQSSNSCWGRYMAAAYANIDTEPDIYSFSFAGHSGKFFFDATRKMHMIPESDYSIIPVSGPFGLFDTWKILAPDGTKFFFGGAFATENNFSSSSALPVAPNQDNRVSTTWHLIRVESMNGEHWINFEYESENYSFGAKASQTYVRSIEGEAGSYTQTSGLTVTNVQGWRPSKITTSSGHTVVDFIEKSTGREDLTLLNNAFQANTEAKALDKIKITTGSKCKEFIFTTDYIQSDRTLNFNVTPETAYDSKRLRLNSIQEKTCGGEITHPAYLFTYDATIPMPRRYSFAEDHWGYHNGKSTNTTRLQPFFDPYSSQNRPGADRAPVENQMMTGILKKISYPTGGFDEFVYEAHRETPSSTDVFGGLRTKSITRSDGAGNIVQQNIGYIQGTLYQIPTYSKNRNTNYYTFPQNTYEFGTEWNSSSKPPLQSTQGYHMGYSIVEIVTPGNGKKVVYYTNTHPTSPSMSYPEGPVVAVIGTAQLFKEEIFDESANLKQRTTYFYSTGPTVSVFCRKVVSLNCMNANPWASCEIPIPLVTDYSLETKRNYLIQKVDLADGVTTTTDYTYDNTYKDNYARSVQYTASDGVIRKSELVYPSDAGSGAPSIMFDPLSSNFKNAIGLPVEERKLLNSVVKEKSTTLFVAVGSNVLATSTKHHPSGTAEKIEQQYAYDQTKRMRSVVKSSGVNTSFLWAYNNTLPVATVENATFAESLTPLAQGFSVSPTSSVISCSNLTGSFTISEEQTITFNPVVSLNGATGLWVDLTMKNSTGGIVFGPRRYSSNGTFAESVFLPAGTYTFCYQSGNYPSPYQGYSSVSFTVNGFGSRRANLSHTSFEENGVAADARTGSKAFLGTYPVKMPHLLGDYMLTYWTKPSAGDFTSWQLVQVPITVTSSSMADYLIGQSGYHVDEVRLYPKGAMMTTYTYEPGVGMSSTTDPNNVSSFYEYDAFGRLIGGKDNNKHLVKAYQYHLKGQN